MEMANLGVSELRNPRTNCHKIWQKWLRQRHAMQAKIQTDRPMGASRQMGEISLPRGF